MVQEGSHSVGLDPSTTAAAFFGGSSTSASSSASSALVRVGGRVVQLVAAMGAATTTTAEASAVPWIKVVPAGAGKVEPVSGLAGLSGAGKGDGEMVG